MFACGTAITKPAFTNLCYLTIITSKILNSRISRLPFLSLKNTKSRCLPIAITFYELYTENILMKGV